MSARPVRNAEDARTIETDRGHFYRVLPFEYVETAPQAMHFVVRAQTQRFDVEIVCGQSTIARQLFSADKSS